MQFSTLITLSLAALTATAAPVAEAEAAKKNAFQVTNFVFGCTFTCDYSFNLTAPDTSANHPAVKKSVVCSGSSKAGDKTYKNCGKVSATQTLRAYIDHDTNALKLQYEVVKPKEGAKYWYEGQTKVYSATGPDAKKQKKDFKVVESKAYAVA